MSKRKFDDSLHTSIVDDDDIAGADAEFDDDEHPPSASVIVDDEHPRCVKKARCDIFSNEATTSEKNERLSFATPIREPCAIGNDVTSTLNKLKQPSNKKRVRFGAVSIYYFQRSQGFSCVPTSGGSTLGMSRKHHLNRVLSLNDHLEEIRRQREVNVEEQRRSTSNGHQDIHGDHDEQDEDNVNANHLAHSETYGNGGSIYEYVINGDSDEYDDGEAEYDDEFDEESSNGFINGTEEEVLAVNANRGIATPNAIVQPEYQMEQESNELDSSSMPDDYYLQPLDSKQRRTILRAIGIQVDRDERDECQAIRLSRQSCGCNCRGQCLPETCACAIDQIKCQVDRPTFPCACTKNSCFNPFGRVEFNAVRVRTHYLHTMMRIKIENKQQSVLPSPTHVRFDKREGYVDQDVRHDLVKNGGASSSNGSGFRMFSSPTRSLIPSGNGYMSSTTMLNGDSSMAHTATQSDSDNQNFWLMNGVGVESHQSSGHSDSTTPFLDQSTTYGVNDDVRMNGYQTHQKTVKTMNNEVEHYLQTRLASNNNAVVFGVDSMMNGSPSTESNTNDDDDADDTMMKMRDRSSSFCSKSTKSSSNVIGNSPTYSLASLYPHQHSSHYVQHQNGADGRSHSFNEFLDPLYFPTFALANECNCGNVGGRCECTSDDEDDEAEDTSSFPSDESNSLDANTAEKMMVMKNCDDSMNERSNRDGSNGVSAYLPSSPAELSAVLKKSICETVLA